MSDNNTVRARAQAIGQTASQNLQPGERGAIYDSDDESDLYVTSANEQFQRVLLGHVDREINALTEILEDKDLALLNANDARVQMASKLAEAMNRLRRFEGMIHKKDRELEQRQYDWKTLQAEKETATGRMQQAEAKAAKLESLVEKLRSDLSRTEENLIAAKHLNTAYSLDVDVHDQVERRMVTEVNNANAAVVNYSKREQQLLAQLNQEKEAGIALQKQLEDQENETKTAQRMLEKVVDDLNVANASKKILLQQWQQALDAMTRRDAVLQDVQDVQLATKSELTGAQAERESLLQENKALEALKTQHSKKLAHFQQELAQMRQAMDTAKKEEARLADALALRTKQLHRLEDDHARAQHEKAQNAKRAEDASRALQKKTTEVDKKQRAHYWKEEQLVREADEAKREAQATVEEVQAEYKQASRVLTQVEQEKVQMRARELQLTTDLQRVTAEYELISKDHAVLKERYEDLFAEAGRLTESLMRKEHRVNFLRSKLELQGVDKEASIVAPYKDQIVQLEAKLKEAETRTTDLVTQCFQTQRELVTTKNALEKAQQRLEHEKSQHQATETMEDKASKELAEMAKERDEARVETGAVQVKLNRVSALLARERKRCEHLESQVEEARILREAKAKDANEEISRLKADLQHLRGSQLQTNINALKTDQVNSTLAHKMEMYRDVALDKRQVSLQQDKEIRRLRAELTTTRNSLLEAKRAQNTLVRHLESVYPRALEARQQERTRRARAAAQQPQYDVFQARADQLPTTPRSKGGSLSQMSMAHSTASDVFSDNVQDLNEVQPRAVTASSPRGQGAVTFAEDTKSEGGGSVRHSETRGSMSSRAKSREAVSRDSMRLRQRYAELAAKLQSLDHAFADATESNRIMASTIQDLKRDHDRIQGRTLRAEALATSLEHQLRKAAPGTRIVYEYTPDLVASPELAVALNAWSRSQPVATTTTSTGVSGADGKASLHTTSIGSSLDEQLADLRQSVIGKRTAPGEVHGSPAGEPESPAAPQSKGIKTSVVGPKRFPPSVVNTLSGTHTPKVSPRLASSRSSEKSLSGKSPRERKLRHVPQQGSRHSGSGATHLGSPRKLDPLVK